MKVVLFCGGMGLRIRDAADIPNPWCDWVSADSLACYEVLRSLRAQGFHSVPWVSSGCGQELLSGL